MSTSRFHITEHVVPSSHIREYPRALADAQEDVLQLAVKQYTPKDNARPKSGDITILGAHANGFPKELYEPLWDDLHEHFKAKNINIRSIWIADVAWQGQSGILNEDKLGNDPGWIDHSRDLFLLINHFRTHFVRPIFGIGHSMGGAQLVNLSLMHPRLFTSLVLMDPVIQRFPSQQGNYGPARASTTRRDVWPSRRAAEAAFKKSKFYQTWDPRTLDRWVQFGLREVPTKAPGHVTTASSSTLPAISAESSSTMPSPSTSAEGDREVTLSTTKHQEVFTFLRTNLPTPSNPDPWRSPNRTTHPDVDVASQPVVPFYRPEPMSTFHRLPHVRPGVLYVFGETSYLSLPVLQADKLAATGIGVGGSGGVRAGRVKGVTIGGVGHLIPMEDVGASARETAEWIAADMERWRVQEEGERQEWRALSREQKRTMGEDFVRIMKSDWTVYEEPSPLKKGSRL